MERQSDRSFAEAIAHVARALQAEPSAQATLQKMVDLAVATIEGCDDAGVTIIDEREFRTPSASIRGPACSSLGAFTIVSSASSSAQVGLVLGREERSARPAQPLLTPPPYALAGALPDHPEQLGDLPRVH